MGSIKARFSASVKLVAFVAVAVLVALSMVGGASAQDYGGFAQNGGPIQFPPAPMSSDTNGVVIGGSGFGFVPPRSGGSNYNFGPSGGYRDTGSRYRGAGGRYNNGGYRGSGSSFGGFGGYGGYGLRGSGNSGSANKAASFGTFITHW